MSDPALPRGYMPQLDSLRTVAVFGVMLHHFWPEAEVTLGLTLGFLGVQLFFVLSGFLITGILLRGRDAVDADGQSVREGIGLFYARRFLRIFPLFYATLAVAWLVGLPEVRDSLPWHLAYASNIYFVHIGDWHGSISHLWSLAVEEQFYLVWPFVIFLTPRRFLLPVLVGVAVIAPLFRVFGALADLHWMAWFVLPFANCDSLALGGILAYAWTAERRRPFVRSTLVRSALWIGVPAVLGLWYREFSQRSTPSALGWIIFALENTLWAIFFIWLVDRTARGVGGPVGRLLESRPLTYLGRISYGIYVFHPFMVRIVPWSFARIGIAYPGTRFVEFLTLAAATVLLAACSWRFYERPLNDLKRHFEYVPRRDSQLASAS